MLEKYINALKCATYRFCSADDLDRDRVKIATEMELLETQLNERFHLGWDEIEELEISFMIQHG